MENEIINKPNFLERIKDFIIEKKKIFIISFSILTLSIAGLIFLNYIKINETEKISEKYVLAGIYLSKDENEKSKSLFKEIIESKNKFYSPLALNIIIDNNLETNDTKILDYFELVEKINLKKEEKNLIKLKKALYLKKISKEKVANKLLNEIIEDKSIWKNSAQDILEN